MTKHTKLKYTHTHTCVCVCVYIYIWIYNIYIINIYITIIPQGGETSESFQIVRKANCLSLGIQNLNTITGTTVIYLSNVNI